MESQYAEKDANFTNSYYQTNNCLIENFDTKTNCNECFDTRQYFDVVLTQRQNPLLNFSKKFFLIHMFIKTLKASYLEQTIIQLLRLAFENAKILLSSYTFNSFLII